MTQDKACPFCGGTELETSRFTLAGSVNGPPSILETDSPTGDYVSVSCMCGCRLIVSIDGLHDRFYSTHDYEEEFTEESLWAMLWEVWDNRPLEGS